MATTTIAGTSVVFSNSTAAANLTQTVTEEGVFAFDFDVVTLSGGGGKATLYSIDNGVMGDNAANPVVAVSSSFAGYDTDLLYKDGSSKNWATGGETSLKGAKIWIGNDNKVHYDVSSLGASFQALGAGQSFTDSFKYTIQLSNGTLSVGTLTFVVTGVNDVPTITGVFTGDLTEDSGTLVAQGAVTVTDVDTGESTFTLANATNTYGTFVQTSTGWKYTLNNGAANVQALAANQTVQDTVTIKTADGTTKSVVVTIHGTNDAPVAQVSVGSGNEGATITGQALASDVDNGTTLTYAVSGSAPTGFTLNANGSWTFDATGSAYDHLAVGQAQDIVVSFTASDGALTSTPKTLTITIVGTNDAPVATASTGAANEGSTTSGNVSATDADDNAILTYSLVGDAPAGFSMGSNGAWTFDANDAAYNHLAAGVKQDVVVTFVVNDGTVDSASKTLTITVTGTNDAPVATASTADATEGSTASGSVSATDADDNAVLTYSVVGEAPAGFVLNSNGSWTFDAANSAYDHLAAGGKQDVVVAFVANDGLTNSASKTLTITVTGTNDAPVATASTGAVDEGATASGSVSATDADDNAVLTYSVVGTSPAGFSMGSNGAWTFDANDPAYNHLAAGVKQDVVVTFVANDGTVDSASKTLTITVTGTNDAPVAAASTGAVDEGSTTSGSISATDVDDNTTLTYSVVGDAPAGFVLNSNGNWTFDAANAAYDHLAAGVKQDVVVTFMANDGIANSAPKTVTITVTGTNDAPVASASTGAVNEGSSASGSVSATDADDGASLTYSVVGASPAGFALGSNGAWTFDANDPAYNHLAAGVKQDVIVTFIANDGTADSASKTLTITVTGTNDAPVAVASTGAVNEGATTSGSVSATDADDGATLTYSVVGASPAGFALGSNGAWTFDANDPAYNHLAAGVKQDVVVTFVANDGTVDSASKTLTITVTGTNDAPVATASTGAVNEGATTSGSVSATDADDGTTLTYSVVGASPAGFALGSNGAWTFDANDPAYNHLAAGVKQDVVVTFVANDGTVDSTSKTLTITVTGTNDAPVAVASTGAVNEGATTSGSVSANDADDGATLTYSVVGESPAGFALNANGAWTFDANNAAYNHLAASAKQDVVVTFIANDGTADSASKTLTITVTGTNDGPVATVAMAAVNEGSSTSGVVSATDADDSASLTYHLVGGPVAGLTFGSNGAWSFDANDAAYNHLAAGVVQNVVVNLAANDGAVDSATQTLTIAVTGTNDAATFGGGPFTGSVTEDGTLTASGTVSVSDPDDSQNTFAAGALVGTYGTFAVTSGGWSYALNNSAANVQALTSASTVTDTLTLTSADGSKTQVVTVTIHGADDADSVTTFDYDTKDVNGNALVESPSTGGGHQFNGSNAAETIVASNDAVNGDGVNAQGGGDTVYARGGNDTIQGQNGDDVIYGGSGDDTITGGAGADSLWGGSGNDRFVYATAGDSAGASQDTINDFHHGFDKIDLSAVYGGTLAWGNGTATANGVWFTESGGFTIVHVDTNGVTGTEEMTIKLAGTGLGLTASDFVL